MFGVVCVYVQQVVGKECGFIVVGVGVYFYEDVVMVVWVFGQQQVLQFVFERFYVFVCCVKFIFCKCFYVWIGCQFLCGGDVFFGLFLCGKLCDYGLQFGMFVCEFVVLVEVGGGVFMCKQCVDFDDMFGQLVEFGQYVGFYLGSCGGKCWK